MKTKKKYDGLYIGVFNNRIPVRVRVRYFFG